MWAIADDFISAAVWYFQAVGSVLCGKHSKHRSFRSVSLSLLNPTSNGSQVQTAPCPPFHQNTRHNRSGWHSGEENSSKIHLFYKKYFIYWQYWQLLYDLSATWKSGWISQDRFWTLSCLSRGNPSILSIKSDENHCNLLLFILLQIVHIFLLLLPILLLKPFQLILFPLHLIFLLILHTFLLLLLLLLLILPSFLQVLLILLLLLLLILRPFQLLLLLLFLHPFLLPLFLSKPDLFS